MGIDWKLKKFILNNVHSNKILITNYSPYKNYIYHTNHNKFTHQPLPQPSPPPPPPSPPPPASRTPIDVIIIGYIFVNNLLSLLQSKLLQIILLILLCPLDSEGAQQTTRHTVAVINGDLVLGALFPVHHAPSPKQAQRRICGEVREQYGIQRVEAAFKTVDEINESKNILPNMKLGIEIRDSCWNSPIALEQSIEFIRDAMAASEERSDAPINNNNHGLPPFSNTGQDPFSPLSVFMKSALSGDDSNNPLNSGLNSSSCPRQPHKKVKNIVGVVGPASSSVTIQVIIIILISTLISVSKI